MANNDFQDTMSFSTNKQITDVKTILATVYDALKEKGYDPINQLVGYIISGDPTYITSHKGARYLIRRLERDILLEEIVSVYLARLDAETAQKK